MGFWQFFDAHLFLAWCALWLVWGIVPVVAGLCELCQMMLRSINIMLRGWPPRHLDADGDWRPARPVQCPDKVEGRA